MQSILRYSAALLVFCTLGQNWAAQGPCLVWLSAEVGLDSSS